MLDGLPVLIVEDEFLIALTLADAVKEAGGSGFIGPASTTTMALGLLATARVGAAILDVNLADRDIRARLEFVHRSRNSDRGAFRNGTDAASWPNSIPTCRCCSNHKILM